MKKQNQPSADGGGDSDWSTSSSEHSFDLQKEDDAWKDVNPDEGDALRVKSIFDDQEFESVQAMCAHDSEQYGFDLKSLMEAFLEREEDLQAIQLINYLRKYSHEWESIKSSFNKSAFLNDEYFVPTLSDDALLINWPDLGVCVSTSQADATVYDGPIRQNEDARTESTGEATQKQRIMNLEAELSDVTHRYEDFRAWTDSVLEKRWNSDNSLHTSQSAATTSRGSAGLASDRGRRPVDDDSHYFASYAHIDIHETMLKDAVRTDAYRDFVYDNKNLFKGKTVLDVGCGTGILSMFCARAGAERIFAVDNSEIIHRARRNVEENGLTERITCLRGKVEDIELPVQQVDIIISEWMGYCLLYEAMLDSVLYARDKYLAPSGLMVPSNCKLYLAPFSDPDYMEQYTGFWEDVYGFKMSAMLDNAFDEVLTQKVSPSGQLIAQPSEFLDLPLQKITTKELEFNRTPFSMEITEDNVPLNAFIVWFDTLFHTSSEAATRPPDTQSSAGVLIMSTSPEAPSTHWYQGTLIINQTQDNSSAVILKKGQHIEGEISYIKPEANSRELDIKIRWSIDGRGDKMKQLWHMR
ncbi:hypothetical protein MMC25_007495 [Agyrium rufum]|nr:hypothetical protein [Agyrium rufum]